MKVKKPEYRYLNVKWGKEELREAYIIIYVTHFIR